MNVRPSHGHLSHSYNPNPNPLPNPNPYPYPKPNPNPNPNQVGTPDSSRIWDAAEYAAGRVVENSKEGFRKMLQEHFPERDILLNKDR